MQLKISTGLSASLIAGGLAALVSGCDTPGNSDPKNRSQPPQIVAIYAVDFVGGNISSNDPRSGVGGTPLQDVLIYTTVPADAARVSPAPSSYGGFRIEFDQPLDGATLGANNDLNLSGNSFCSPPHGGATITLQDGSTILPTSICYDPTSNLGQNPHVLVTLGSGVGTTTSGAIANPFTCNDFSADYGTADQMTGLGGLTTMQNNHSYSFNISTGVKSSSEHALAAAAAIPFKTGGFDIMAVGYQDSNTGYFHWLKKPYVGYMKDLAEEGAAFKMPHDSTPLLVITTYGVEGVATENSNPDTGTGSASNEFTLTRAADGSAPGASGGFPEVVGQDIYSATLGPKYNLYGDLVFEPRVTTVTPGDSWEPGVMYKLDITGLFAGADGAKIAAAQSYTFSAASGALAILSNYPADGATSVEPATLANSGRTGPGHHSGFQTTPVIIEFQAPVDVTGCNATGSDCSASTNISATNFQIKDGTGTAVPGTFGTDIVFDFGRTTHGPDVNNQFVQFTPTTGFPLGSTITVTVQNVKAQTLPSLGALSGGMFPTLTFSFTTGNFRINRTRDYNQPTILSGTIDRTTVVPPQDLTSTGSVYLEFTDAADPATVNSANISFTEINTDGTTKLVDPSKYEFVPLDPAIGLGPVTGSRFQMQITDATYALKFNQGYKFIASTAVKTAATGAQSGAGIALKAEGCTTSDCSDSRTFSTLQFGPGCPPGVQNAYAYSAGCRAIQKKRDANGVIIGIKLLFNEPVDATTLPSAAALASTNITMSFADASGSAAKVLDLTCVPSLQNTAAGSPSTDVDTITCTSPSIKPNTTYSVTALFTKDQAPKVSKTLAGGQATDQTSGQFFGSVSRTFTTDCP